eukprot:6485614-Amphidinium_carterae.1
MACNPSIAGGKIFHFAVYAAPSISLAGTSLGAVGKVGLQNHATERDRGGHEAQSRYACCRPIAPITCSPRRVQSRSWIFHGQ